MYYRLQSHCKLVRGAARSAIYDFKTSKVYSINQDAANLLTACLDQPIEDLWDIDSTNAIYYSDFLNKLSTNELGAFHDTSIDLEPVPSYTSPPIKLEFIWLELTSACNSKCLHCYAECGPSSSSSTQQISHSRWLSIIEEAQQLGATALQLIGGEPLLYPAWRELIVKAHQLGYEYIEIFTNATLIDDDCVSFFTQYNVNIATTLYADNAETHDRITLQPNSFNKTMTAIQKILAANIPLRIASIIMKANEHEVANIIKLYEELGMQGAYPDVVRPTGRGNDQDLVPIHYCKPPIKPPFHIDELTFYHAHSYHNCLAGKIAITATGDVIPCIFARDQCCGNILENSLSQILSSPPLQQCWHTTKDQISHCCHCEYRYACFDCRPLAQSVDSEKNWLACPKNCSYNPYTGKWAPRVTAT